MSDAYIFDAVRTPRGRGKSNGALHEVSAPHLAAHVLKELRERNQLDTALIDDVVLGCVEPIGEQGGVVARTAVLDAGYDQTVAGTVVSRFCASGLEAVNIAAAKIKSGEAQMVIGGGVECMSRVPIGSSGGSLFTDPTISYPTFFVPQGVSADLIASRQGYSRDDVDAYAMESQKRAANAWQSGHFKNSIIAVMDSLGNTVLDRDEHMRPDATMQSLGSLNPAFAMMGDMGYDAVAIQRYPEVEKINHVHTPGNSSGIVDGAAGVLIGTKEMGERMGLTARARIRSGASIGSEPCIMLDGPAPSARKVLRNAGMEKGDIDLFELNEAFAAVVMLFMEEMGIGHDQINVNGGAIAMGHPLGATGAMILGTVLDELERRNKETALINLCVGGGMGTATIIERV